MLKFPLMGGPVATVKVSERHCIPSLQVCRSAGYYEHALYVAQASKQPATYLDILVEDCQKWDEALAFLGGEPREESAAALSKYGKVSLS